MDTRYSRNRIYLTADDQQRIKNCPIILAGSGIGSVIAECALRLGFENLTIIDGDMVELSNLNRQNYTEQDIALDKTITIKQRLQAINENANINVHSCYLNSENVESFIEGHEIAINALDFTSDIPIQFDKLCQAHNINILHPYNLGWGGLVTVITPKGISLETLKQPDENFNEVKMVEYASGYMKFWGNPHTWIDEIIENYLNEKEDLPPPQLSIGSWTVAAMCTHLLFKICTNREFKQFPEFYLSTINNN